MHVITCGSNCELKYEGYVPTCKDPYACGSLESNTLYHQLQLGLTIPNNYGLIIITLPFLFLVTNSRYIFSYQFYRLFIKYQLIYQNSIKLKSHYQIIH